MKPKTSYGKIGIICVLFLTMCFLPGCQSAPDKTDTDKGESIEKILASAQYVSLSEARKQVEKLKGKKIDGLYFPEQIQMPDVQSVSEVKLTPYHWEDENDMIQAIRTLWRDYNSVNWKTVKEKILTRKSDSAYFAKEKTDKKTKFHYGYDTSGFFSADSIVVSGTELDVSSCVAEYDFEWGDTASGTAIYPMEDGEVSVPDAVEYTERELNKYLSPIEKNQFTYKIQHLYVMKNPDTGFHDYKMVIGRVYKGIALDTSANFNLPAGSYYDKVHSGAHIVAIMRHRQSLDSIINGTESLEIGEESEKDTVISPFWAVRQIDREIAHVNGLRFEDCGLVYLLVQKNPNVKDKEQGVYGEVDDTTYLRPMWVFMSEGGTNDFASRTKDYHGNSALVDALDGTLYYYMDTGAY